MKKQQVIELLLEAGCTSKDLKIEANEVSLVLPEGLGWVEITETEITVWDDMECFFSESFSFECLSQEEILEKFEIAYSNLEKTPKDWWETE